MDSTEGTFVALEGHKGISLDLVLVSIKVELLRVHNRGSTFIVSSNNNFVERLRLLKHCTNQTTPQLAELSLFCSPSAIQN